jgi:hypothetical protein
VSFVAKDLSFVVCFPGWEKPAPPWPWPGWTVDLSDAEVLERLVALNHERAAEETKSQIRWLRPEFQVGSPVPKPVEGVRSQ